MRSISRHLSNDSSIEGMGKSVRLQSSKEGRKQREVEEDEEVRRRARNKCDNQIEKGSE